MIDLSVITYTVRDGGLDWMLRALSRQTYKNFEWIVVDGFYESRKKLLSDLAKEYQIHLIHLPEPKRDYLYLDYNIAANGNEALLHVTTENIVIIDDYHIFPENLLEEQMKYLKLGYAAMPRWHHVDYIDLDGTEPYDRVVQKLKVTEVDPRSSTTPPGQGKNIMRGCPSSWWWPNATSVSSRFMIDRAQGYDERLNGGTGGTDCEIAWRMQKLGLEYLYLLYLDVYHINTSGRPRRKIPGLCSGVHNREPFTCNQYHQGDPNLVENDELVTFVEDGVKYCTCKHCGAHGIIDSQDVLNANIRTGRMTPPEFAGGHIRTTLIKDREENPPQHETLCVICG